MSRRVLPWLVAGALMVPATGCSFVSALFNPNSQQQGAGPTAQQGPSGDERFMEQVAEKRAAAEGTPNDVDAATEYVGYVLAAATNGVYERMELDPKSRVQEAMTMVQGIEGDDPTMARAKVVESVLAAYLGDDAKEGELLEASYALDPEGPAFDSLVAWYGKQSNDEKIVEMCKAKRETLDYGDALLVVLNNCLTARGATSLEEGLDFVSKGDRAWFDAEMRRVEAEMAAMRAEEERRAAEERAQREAERAAAAQSASSSSSSSSGGSSAPAGPVSVTIRNKCRQTVKVFYGNKPKFGSGRYSSMSSNSSTSHSFRAGDMFWIVDDSQNGLGSVTVSQGMREIEILDSCTGMRTR